MKDFQQNRLKVLLLLTKILKKKYNIKSKNFLGHSDIAPNRKKDPGEKFPWKYLAKYKIGIWYNLPKKNLKFKDIEVSKKKKRLFYLYLKKIGYCLKIKRPNIRSLLLKLFKEDLDQK